MTNLTARHRCDASSELCCPGAMPRRLARHLLHATASYYEHNEGLFQYIFKKKTDIPIAKTRRRINVFLTLIKISAIKYI